jgi:hypothetical protein
MRIALVFLIAVTVLFAVSASVWATPIPGSINELLNWNFTDSPIIGYDGFGRPIYGGGPWQVGQWIAVEKDGINYGLAANCKNDADPTGLWMFQIVDETTNPLWINGGTQKYVDLMADIRVMGDHTDSTLTFQLGWWDTDYPIQPTVPIEGGLPVFPSTGFQWSQAVECSFADPGVWYTVNPFDRILLPEQPRWLVVLVGFDQASGETIWVDNVVLTSNCIPEPMSLVLGIIGLGSIVGFRKLRR